MVYFLSLHKAVEPTVQCLYTDKIEEVHFDGFEQRLRGANNPRTERHWVPDSWCIANRPLSDPFTFSIIIIWSQKHGVIKYHLREVVERVLALWYWSFSSRNVIRFWSHEKMLDGSFGREIVDCIWGLIYKGREDCLHFIWHVIYKCPSSRWNWKHKSGQCQTKHLPSSSWKLRKTLESQCQKGQGWMAKAALSCTMFSAQNTGPVCLTWPLFLSGELSGHLFY